MRTMAEVGTGAAPGFFTIGAAARQLKVCPATLRIWERKKLIAPQRLGQNRLYSADDLARLRAIKGLIQDRGLNLQGVKALLDRPQCWEVKRCTSRQKSSCSYYRTCSKEGTQ